MLIQTALRQRYRRESWTTILLDLFPTDTLKLREKAFPIEEAAHEQIEGPPLQLGTVTLANGERVDDITFSALQSSASGFCSFEPFNENLNHRYHNPRHA